MKIIWTPEAAETFNSNIEWEDQAVLNFLDRVEEVVETIKSILKSFRLSTRKTT